MPLFVGKKGSMDNVLVLQGNEEALRVVSRCLEHKPENQGGRIRMPVGGDFSPTAEMRENMRRMETDFAVLPDMDFDELGLIVSDMDSTLITIECVDEIAACAGLKERVAEITERAMRGELDFEQSLRSRVALLAGLDERVLAEVYENVLKLSPGAEFLLDECKRHNVKFLLVSGGFTFFTERLQQRLGFEYQHANILEIENGRFIARIPQPPRIAAASGVGDGGRCERYSDAQRSGHRRGLPCQTESAGSRRCLYQLRRFGACTRPVRVGG